MIDENELQIKTNTLVGMQAVLNEKLVKIQRVLISLQSIKLKNGEMPRDSRTGQTMSDTTRQEIHDACILVADEMIADEIAQNHEE